MSKRTHHRNNRAVRPRLEPLDDRCLPSVTRVLALGADAGGAPHVRVIDPATGLDRVSFMAYNPAFRGGVSVALGDVTGDGVPDIITAPGAGGGPQVRVFDGRSGANIANFGAYGAAFRGGVRVAVGDVDGDGRADIVTAPGVGGGPDVRVFDATGHLRSEFLAFGPAFRGGVSVAVGDVDGDFKADIVTGAGPGGGPVVKVFRGDGIPLASWSALAPGFRGGVNVAAADLTDDGVAEVIAGAGPGGGPLVKVFNGLTAAVLGSFLGFNPLVRQGVRVAASDCDGDGRPEIVAGSLSQWRAFDATLLRPVAGAPAFGPAYVGGVWVAGPLHQAIDPAKADAVLDWNQVALDAIRTTSTVPPKASRALAMVSAAVYDAVNAVTTLHEFYRANPTSQPTASAPAAASAAAHRVLSALFPALTVTFNTALTNSLAEVPDGPAETEGVQLGQSMADQILSWRANDGSDTVTPYTPGTAPGQWQPTPPAFAPALLPNWPTVTPFAMTSGAQFRPAGPPALDSSAYAADLNQVKDIGRSDSTTRTPDQTQIALFWADGGGTVSPPGHWNLIAQTVSLRQGLSLVENARLFALLNIALADAAIVSWDAKYTYNAWRPVTAIHLADTDGNPATDPDLAWTSLIATPPFPTYTSGHSTFSAAASTVLGDYFGSNVFFTSRGDLAQPYTRSFTSFAQAADEAGMSRIYGGIHFMYDNRDGLASGRALGQYVVASLLP
jgi:membrane-associated phospholipid phosphatase